MNHGRSTCNQLKAIRKQIADANGIAYEPHECTFEGECRGTCPACEGEMRYIERELQRRQSLGKKIAVVGIATGLSAAIATTQQSCSFTSPSDRPINPPDKESTDDIMDEITLPPPPHTTPRTTQTSQEYVKEHIRMYNGSPLWISSSESGDNYVIEEVNIIASPKKVCTPRDQHSQYLDIQGDISIDDIDDDNLIILDGDDDVEITFHEIEEDGVEEDGGFMGLIVEEQPEFPGGSDAMRQYLKENTHYPTEAIENGIQGRVFVSFDVDTVGNITNVKVVRHLDPTLDNEAVRVVKSMPQWKPGKQRGKAAKAVYILPINFILQ